MKNQLVLSALLIAISASYAEASIITYGSRATFDLAVGGQTLIDFEAQSGNYYGSNLTIGPVSFTQGNSRLFVLDPNDYSTGGLNSAYLNHNDAGTLPVIIQFGGGGVYSVGMDIGQLYPWHGPVGNLSFTLSSGDVVNVTGLQQLANTSNTTQFVGFTSTVAITSITINDVSGSVVIDNFAYSSNTVVTPEPATCVTFLGIITCVGLARLPTRRRRG